MTINQEVNEAIQDPLYQLAVNAVVEYQSPRIPFLQRKLRIGYNRAANMIEQMEIDGIVSSCDKQGRRTVLKKFGRICNVAASIIADDTTERRGPF